MPGQQGDFSTTVELSENILQDFLPKYQPVLVHELSKRRACLFHHLSRLGQSNVKARSAAASPCESVRFFGVKLNPRACSRSARSQWDRAEQKRGGDDHCTLRPKVTCNIDRGGQKVHHKLLKKHISMHAKYGKG